MSTLLNNETRVQRPVLRYHGGKWMLAPWIVSHFPRHRVYVEPYAGAASVLMRKPRSNGELISDLDGEVVNVFRVLRDVTQARELKRVLALTPFARSEFEAAYLPDGDPVEQARRTLLKSFAGFGADGLLATWRTGFRDNIDKPSGGPAREWMTYPDAVDAFTARLRGVVVENRPALDLILKHDGPGSLIYCDPPYPHATRPGLMKRKHSYRFEISDDEHRELGATLREVRGMVVLSGYACELYDKELFPDWHRVTRGHYADGANPRTEVLWINEVAWDASEKMRSPLFAKGDTEVFR